MDAINLKLGMVSILAGCIALLCWGLLRRHRIVNSKIDLDDLLLGDDGKLAKAAAVMLGAFMLTSWGMVYMWLKGTMTEGYFAAYLGAWVLPSVTRLITNRPSAAPTEPT